MQTMARFLHGNSMACRSPFRRDPLTFEQATSLRGAMELSRNGIPTASNGSSILHPLASSN
jgi:hypothetical protein